MSDLIKTITRPVQEMKYYSYDQTNSGGKYCAPAMYLFVAARSPQEADLIAEELGADFDDSCSCCGSRWSRADSFDEMTKEEFDEERLTTVPRQWEAERCKKEGILYALFVE